MNQVKAERTVVSNPEWLEARKAHLVKEKALTRQRDELLRERRELPWRKVTKEYIFDGPDGKQRLADLFEDKSQLIVYHFMFGPEWEQGCPSCSMVADTMDANLVHVTQRDVAFAVISRAPISKIEMFKRRMGWRFSWVSSFGNDFNRDFAVSFTTDELAGEKIYNFGTSSFPADEAPGLSTFYKDEEGNVFHTYSSYGRGLEPLLGVYSLLDMAPKGRDEDGLPYPMAWVRHHDCYEGTVAKRASKCCSESV
jgi:predicted dithiol-disulfide oxidoreductase (DUF899 family)